MNGIKNTANLLFLLVLISLFSLQVHADIVYLNNGNTIEGETRVDEEAGTIIVTIPGAGDLILGKHEVVKIKEAPVLIVPAYEKPNDAKSWIKKLKKTLRIPSFGKGQDNWSLTPVQVQELANWAEEYQQSLSPVRWFAELVIPLIGYIVFRIMPVCHCPKDKYSACVDGLGASVDSLFSNLDCWVED